MGDGKKSLGEIHSITALPSSTKLAMSSQKTIRVVRQFSFCESMWITPNHILVLCVFRNSFQDFLHDLSGEQGKAGQPIVLWILSLAHLRQE